MKIGTYVFAVAVLALSTTASLAAPTPVPTVGPAPSLPKVGVVTRKSVTVLCPSPTNDGSGVPAMTIEPVDVPAGWYRGSTTAIRLMTASIADGKFTCAYGGLQGAPAVRTSKAIPAGYSCVVATDGKTFNCTY